MPVLFDRMLYWSVGGDTDAARYIYRTTLDGATAADNVQQFVDVIDNNDTAAAAAAAVLDIVVDVRTRRYLILTIVMNYCLYLYFFKLHIKRA